MVSLLVVAGVGRVCLFMVINRRLGILKKNGTKWGQNVIHGDSIENGSAINGNVSALYGRPTRAFKFKLTTAFLTLRVYKPEGGRRVVT